MNRRQVLGAAVGAALASFFARRAAAASLPPVLFVSHGAPLFAVNDPGRIAELRAWGATLPPAAAIVVMTPHFASRRIAIGATGTGVALRNLPPAFAAKIAPGLGYATPASTVLADRVAALVGGAPRDARPGFDHTTWMPLACLYPAATAPVIELAWPYTDDAGAFALGKKLAPLRAEGVVFVGSGGMTHNLASVDLPGLAETEHGFVPNWSREFDEWATGRLAARDVDALLDWRRKAPAAELAHPDDGAHFRMLLVALGVSGGAGGASFPVTGFESTLSKRSVQLG